MPLTVKDKYKNTIVAFNNSAKPLGERNDLHVLYQLSRRNKNILDYFDQTPTDSELSDMKDQDVLNNPKLRPSSQTSTNEEK